MQLALAGCWPMPGALLHPGPAGLSEPVFSARGVVMENAVVRGSSGAPEG